MFRCVCMALHFQDVVTRYVIKNHAFIYKELKAKIS